MESDETSQVTPAASAEQTSLDGVRICLVFEHSLSHYTRYLREIRALQDAGAEVQLLTSHPNLDDAPDGIRVTVAPVHVDVAGWISRSPLPLRPLRRIDNKARRFTRRVVRRVSPALATRFRDAALRRLVDQVDVFWVSDYLSLPTVLRATKNKRARVVYETVDLVPEYPYRGERHRARLLQGERDLIGLVDGFITACDSYADYYREKYSDILKSPPVVCDNSPDHSVSAIRPSAQPLRIVFFGNLMFDRPVIELIEAMALVRSDVTLTFQGLNHLLDVPAARIVELGLQDKVVILDPCSPEDTVEAAHAYDIGMVALRGADENERRATTSKLLTYLSAGLAVLGSDLPGIARVVNAWENGILVKGLEPQTWADAIDRLASMPLAEIDAMKQRSLDASEHFAWEHQRDDFIAVFVRALDG